MRFNKAFQRRKGAGAGKVIGSDGTAGIANPPTGAPSNQDNVLSIKPYSNQGWPCHRVGIAYKGTGGTALPCELWFYDHLTEAWYLIEAAKNLALNGIVFFDVASLIDQAATQATLGEPTSGAIEVYVKIQDNALPDGLYTFAIGADLTTLAV